MIEFRGWMIVRDGKPVIYQGAAVNPVLVFRKKWEAQGALWNRGESLVRVTVRTDENTTP